MIPELLKKINRRYALYMFMPPVGAPRVELGLHAPKARVLPLYYAPFFTYE